MLKTIFLDEEEIIEVSFNYYPGEARTWDYPGCSEEIEIECITVAGGHIPVDTERLIIDHFGFENIENLCFEHVRDTWAADKLDAEIARMEGLAG